jgi:hypothetical protein
MKEGSTKYLQQRATKLYLTREGEWTEHAAEAVTVKNLAEALAYCRKYQLSGMDIVLKFGREEYDVRLELSDHFSAP